MLENEALTVEKTIPEQQISKTAGTRPGATRRPAA